MNLNKVIDFNYQNLDSKIGIMKHCEMANVDIRSIHHSKIKNYVMNNIYCTDELENSDKLLFTFIYDLKAQQKYLPGIYINQEKLAYILGKSPSSISRGINKLIEFNILLKEKDRFGDEIIIPNENINTWAISTDVDRLNFLEEKRKHTASSNTQLNQEFKSYLDMK